MKERVAVGSFLVNSASARTRRRYNASLELDASQLRAALGASSQALLVVDALDRICFANDAASRLLEASRDHLDQSDLQSYLLMRADSQIAQRGGALERVEDGASTLELLLADGRGVRATLTALHDRWGQITHVAIGLELTSQPRAEASLEALGRLAGELAHDINNQLSAALNYVFILQRRVGRASPWFTHLDELQSAAWHAASLAGGLRLVARARSAEPERVTLGTALAKLEPLLRHLARDVRLELEIADDVPDVHAPLAYLEQVVVMATVYALARTEPGSVLQLSAHAFHVAPEDAPTARLSFTPMSPVAVTPVASLASMSHTNSVLRRALKRAQAHLGHSARRIWVDFPCIEGRRKSGIMTTPRSERSPLWPSRRRPTS